jgi:hypothetical protein
LALGSVRLSARVAVTLPAVEVVTAVALTASFRPRASLAAPLGSLIETVALAPLLSVTLLAPSSATTLTPWSLSALAVVRDRVALQPDAAAVGQETAMRATSEPWRRTSLALPIFGPWQPIEDVGAAEHDELERLARRTELVVEPRRLRDQSRKRVELELALGEDLIQPVDEEHVPAGRWEVQDGLPQRPHHLHDLQVGALRCALLGVLEKFRDRRLEAALRRAGD